MTRTALSLTSAGLLALGLSGCPSAPPATTQAWVMPAATAATDDPAPLPQRFSLISWNVHKQLGEPGWQREFAEMQQAYTPDLLTLQEANVHPEDAPEMAPYHYAFGANLQQSGGGQSGVMSLTSTPILSARLKLTTPAEPITHTPKATLLTQVALGDKQSLMLVNIHGINFVTNSDYRQQLDRLEAQIANHQGPVIFAGDFNTWSSQRQTLLSALARRQGLSKVAFSDQDREEIKQFLGQPLDHILYSCQLTPVPGSSQVLSEFTSSDHTPLMVEFEYSPSCG
ncbi:endonuclease/exonuclease/phosphatase family protein [Ferrimonas sediminicola]|uniref:Endonuclease/exonuclease/phosphatase family protein n=1 Tax=Ferrimonas sediminicola TaxID=2569538 RepID=A0A4U1BHL4_9GAMM|nr:endonuclease/exonuclease/phosphatase family protein [Ferrimonas sediminicola]TKB50256.1 endonuclease/exonuclease/phosphatase family protein [Ferrimonas sediminicola]